MGSVPYFNGQGDLKVVLLIGTIVVGRCNRKSENPSQNQEKKIQMEMESEIPKTPLRIKR